MTTINDKNTSYRKGKYKKRRESTAVLSFVFASVLSFSVHASDLKSFNIEAGSLSTALLVYSRQSSTAVVASEDIVAGKTVSALNGDMDSIDALKQLLEGTGLKFRRSNNDGVIIYKSVVSPQAKLQKTSYNTAANYEAGTNVNEENKSVDMDNVFELEEVIVTASRRSESLQNVAAGITSVDPDDYVMKGLTSVGDIIDYSPGINYATSGSPAFGTITVRGVGQESSIPVVGVYVDDVPFSTNSPFSGGSNILFDGLLGDVERVEIIKGPQGTLYGAGAVGGVVRYITKDPALQQFRANAVTDISSTQEGGISELYKATISTPIVEDKIGLTVSGFYDDQAGFIDRIDGSQSVIEDDVNDSQTYGFSANTLVMFGDSGEVKLGGLYYKTKHSDVNQVDFTYPALDSANGRYESSAEASPIFVRYKKLDATISYDFGWAELTSVSAHMQYEGVSDDDLTPALGGLVDGATGSPPGTNTIPYNNTISSEKVIQEIRLASPANDAIEWLAGIFYIKEDTENSQTAVAEPSGFNILTSASPSEYEETAFFGNVTYYITPDFDMTLGLRYSDNSLGLDGNFSGAFAANPGAFSSVIEDKVTTYLFNTRYRVHENMSLYTRIASGYRPAFVNLPIRDPVSGIAINDAIVDSDLLWSYELGIKGDIPDSRLRYDFAVWRIEWDEFQASIDIQDIGSNINAEDGISAEGFEGAVQYYPIEDLMIQTSFAYTDSVLRSDEPRLDALKGESTRNIPKWSGSIQADYYFSVADWESSIGTGVRYTGKQNTQYSQSSTINFPVSSYVLVDFNMGFVKDNYTVAFYINNLLNKYAVTTGSVLGGGVAASAAIVQPRTVGLSLGLNF